MSITAEREEVVDFAQGYLPPTKSAYLAATADVDLKSGPVSAQTGTIQAGYIAEQGMTLLEFATPEETIDNIYLALLSRKATADEKELLKSVVAENSVTNKGDALWAALNTRQFYFIQ